MTSFSSGRGRHSRPIHSLILDTAPLLTMGYSELKAFHASRYYTVPLAKEEVRDESARAALARWGDELNVRQPLKSSVLEGTTPKAPSERGLRRPAVDILFLVLWFLAFGCALWGLTWAIVVTEFAKKTGDYGVLSLTDIHLLALTYELECELNHGDWRLLKEPGSVSNLLVHSNMLTFTFYDRKREEAPLHPGRPRILPYPPQFQPPQPTTKTPEVS